ncbi:MAG TPA: long-chain fatty acid--CoA ligase [Syntrophales bacterium]|nr:long-chain fatty acid--CoA ligase [Syntrophales bacterium]HPQ42787.1 long-chain fatty acid--CoA ligase [Syntrophales bacterium]
MAHAIRYEDKPWLTSYEKGVPEFVDYEDVCIPDFLDRAARDFPGLDALIFQGYKVTYAGLKEMVDRFATCLTAFGVTKGDAVGILLPNLIPCVAAYYAILQVGGIAVMNNPLYSDVELEHQFTDSGTKVLITLDLLGNRMIDLRPKTQIKQIVYTSIGDYLPFPKNILFPLVAKKQKLAADVKPAQDVYKWKECIAQYGPEPTSVTIDFEDVAMYQYTGGTTGVSKGVMLTHANLSKQVQQIAAWIPTFKRGKERMLGALPFFHVFGLSTAMNLSVCMGWTDILVPKPQSEPLLETIGKFKPTFAPLVPTMYIGMLNHPNIKKTDMSCIKGCFSGSAPLPVEVIHDFEKVTGSIIIEGFGMTETTPVTHVNPFAGGERKVGSIGVPISDTLARIVDLDDGETDMPVGEAGELIIKGPQTMKGYKGMPNETANTLRDGWVYTGDIATMDDDGYFYIVDRKKDMIISGGYNVYPRDIDEVFYENPKVQEACAIGVPDPKRGENVKVFVVLKEGETATEEEMIEFCKGRLATYKLPTEVEFRKELPKTNIGKILRKDLRKEELEKRKR